MCLLCGTQVVGLNSGAALIDAPILAFPTETGLYILDTDASNFGLGGVLSQIQNDQERVVAYCSRALRPSQRRYCTTKREMLAAVAMCIQFRSYLRGARFTPPDGSKVISLVASLQRYRRHDVPMVTHLATVPVLHCTQAGKGSREC